MPVAAGIVIGIGDVTLKFSDSFSLSGIALGTIVAIAAYHLAKALAPAELRARADGAVLTVGGKDTYGDSDGIDDLNQAPPALTTVAGPRRGVGGHDRSRSA